jgi:hypothetical protein
MSYMNTSESIKHTIKVKTPLNSEYLNTLIVVCESLISSVM